MCVCYVKGSNVENYLNQQVYSYVYIFEIETLEWNVRELDVN